MIGRHVAVAAAAVAAAGTAPVTAQALPVVNLRVAGAIPDERKVSARVRAPGYAGRAGIETRGHTSQRFPKKSYSLELRTRAGDDRPASLLGMPADGDWVLYAAYNDKTLMRNVLAFTAARRTGQWAARTRFVELRLNGRYRGVYVLMERPELNERRIDVPGTGITGRYLLEWTFPFQARTKGPFFRTRISRRALVYEDPERSDLSAGEARYVRTSIDEVETALYRGPRGAWRDVLDPAATVDYVLVQELFKNVDAFRASTFLVKPADAPWRFGPVWDFDLSTGNSTSAGSGSTSGWWTAERAWASRLHADPTFRSALRARWRELRASGFRGHLLRTLDRAQRRLRPAAARNFARWPVLHTRVWPNPAARGSFAAEVRFLRRWLDRRMRWLDRASTTASPTRSDP